MTTGDRRVEGVEESEGNGPHATGPYWCSTTETARALLAFILLSAFPCGTFALFGRERLPLLNTSAVSAIANFGGSNSVDR